MCGTLNEIEDSMKKLLRMTSKMTMIEFFEKQYEITAKINKINNCLNNFGTYLPNVHLQVDDAASYTKIKEDLTTIITNKLQKHLKSID